MDAAKTKEFAAIVNNLSLSDKKTLFVLPETNPNIYLSSRNLRKAKVVTFSELNTYDILHADQLVVCEGTIEKFANL
jgi:large subunit ribosomal protein L4